jgi:hypothetical protein
MGLLALTQSILLKIPKVWTRVTADALLVCNPTEVGDAYQTLVELVMEDVLLG